MKKNENIFLSVKDYSVTGESFELLYNEELGMLETFPQPLPERIPDYYNSEDYISHTDSKRNLIENVYHIVKSISIKRKLRLIKRISTNGKRLLDFGCGTGDFLVVAKNKGWKVVGIEPNEKARKIANVKTEGAVFETEQISNFETNVFDVITLWHVFEHLPNLEEQIISFKKLLKPDGVLIIAVPNYRSYDAGYYKEFWAAYDVPRHLWHFSKSSISKLFDGHEMKVEKTLPMVFDSYYVSLLSEKYKSGFMNPLKAFWTGMLSNLKAKRSGEYSSLIYMIKNSQ